MKTFLKKYSLIILTFIVFILVFIGFTFAYKNTASKQNEINTNQMTNNDNTLLIIEDNSIDKSEAVAKKENPLANRNVFFAGYTDATISKTSSIILENLPDNKDFLMKYEITNLETGEVVYETNLITSGQCVLWVPGETLEEGTYKLQFLAKPYFQEENGNFLPLTAGSNTVQYIITE